MKTTKLVSIALLMFSLVTVLNAQERYTAGFFTSTPLGLFAQTGEGESGYAKSGQGFMLENRTRGSSWPEFLYIGMHLKYLKFEIDRVSLTSDLYEALEIDPNNSSYQFNIFTGSYRPVVLTVGPHFVKSLGGKFDIELKTQFGIMFTNVDPILLEVIDPQGSVLSDSRLVFNSSPNISYRAGIGLNYNISEYVGLTLFADQSYAKEGVSEQGTDPGEDDYQKISFLNTGLAISIRFL